MPMCCLLGMLQVVPVLLGALPLQEDYDEAEAVYGALADLLVNPETAHRVSPSLAPILQVGLCDKNVVLKTALPTSDLRLVRPADRLTRWPLLPTPHLLQAYGWGRCR